MLLDTRTTHNFVFEDEAKRLSLKATKVKEKMKSVSSPTKPIVGTTQGVHLTLGTWSRKLNFSIEPMDNFKMVHVFLLQATNFLRILNGSKACMVLTKHNKTEEKTLPTMQFQRAFKKDPSFLVSIREVSEGKSFKMLQAKSLRIYKLSSLSSKT